jgi:hypothetical protein
MSLAPWPNHWRDVSDPVEAGQLTAELQRETPYGHRLYGQRLFALARRDDRDDVLFTFEDGQVAEVHLTWSAEADPNYPRTNIFDDADVWRDQLSGD